MTITGPVDGVTIERDPASAAFPVMLINDGLIQDSAEVTLERLTLRGGIADVAGGSALGVGFKPLRL